MAASFTARSHFFSPAKLFFASVLILSIWMLPKASAQNETEGLIGGLSGDGWQASRGEPDTTQTPSTRSRDEADGPPRIGFGLDRPARMPPSYMPTGTIEGNYLVSIEGIPGASKVYARLQKGGHYSANNEAQTYLWTRAPEAEWAIVSRPAIGTGRDFGGGVFRVVPENSTSPKLTVNQGNVLRFTQTGTDGLLDSDYQIRAKPNSGNPQSGLRGNWRTYDPETMETIDTGRMIWRRLVPRIQTVQTRIGDLLTDNAEINDQVTFGSRPVRVTLPEGLRDRFGPNTNFTRRGNRPSFVLEVTGEDMWGGPRVSHRQFSGSHPLWIDPESGIELTPDGAQPILRTLDDGTVQSLGARIELTLWQQAKPGVYSLYFDGQAIPFELAFGWSDSDPQLPALTSLKFRSIDGRDLRTIREGEPFKVRAEFNDEHPHSVIGATIPADNPRQNPSTVELARSSDPSVFESRYLKLVRSDRANGESDGELVRIVGESYDRAASQELIGAHFQGEWYVQHQPLSDGSDPQTGRSKVFRRGDRMLVMIEDPEGAKFYETEDLYAESRTENGAELNRLRAILEHRPELDEQYRRQNNNVDGLGRGRPLVMHSSRISLPIQIGDRTELAEIAWREDGLERVQFDLRTRNRGSGFSGAWSSTRNQETVTQAGQIWTRLPPAQLSVVAVADDQLGERTGSSDRNYNYPFDSDGGRTLGEETRSIIVVGRNLPENAEQLALLSEDNLVEYRLVEQPPHVLEALRISAHALAQSPLNEGEKAILLEAKLKASVRPGIKSFKINGHPARWNLAFSDQQGALKFLRQGSTLTDPQDHLFYAGEELRVGFLADGRGSNLPLSGMKVLLEAALPSETEGNPPERRPLMELTLTSTPDTQINRRNAAISQAIVVAYGADGEQDTAAGQTAVFLNEGERLVALPLIPASPKTVRPVFAEIDAGPVQPNLWQESLEKVARCHGLTPDYALARSFVGQTAPVRDEWLISNTLDTRRMRTFYDLGRLRMNSGYRQARLSNGDHAAMLIIRNELVRQLIRKNAQWKRELIDVSNPIRTAQGYWSDARNNPEQRNTAFWARPAWEYNGRTRPLSGLLDLDEARAWFGSQNRADTQDTINDVVAKHIRDQYNETKNAIDRATAAGNCNLDELLVVASYRSEEVFSAIRPNLMTRTQSGWIPNNTALGAVQGVYMAGREIRALDDWRKIDDGYKAMAMAGAASGLAALGAGVGMLNSAQASQFVIGADLADMAYFGRKGWYGYEDAERGYSTALGLAPVLGSGVVESAASSRDSQVMAAIGLIAPGAGALMGRLGLTQLRNIERGRELVSQNADELLSSVRAMPVEDRMGIAAYVRHLEETDASRLRQLSRLERTHLDQIRGALRNPDGTPLAAYAPEAAQQAARSDIISPEDMRPISEQWAEFEKNIDELILLPGRSSVDTLPPPRPGLAATSIDTAPPPGPMPSTLIDDFTDPMSEVSNATRTIPEPDPSDARTATLFDGPELPPLSTLPDAQNSGRLRAVDQNGQPVDIEFDPNALGQGSFNTAFRNGDRVTRVPGGRSGRPSSNALIADSGGRRVFEEAMAGANPDTANIRIVDSNAYTLSDDLVIPASQNSNRVVLRAGDVVEDVEYMQSFKDSLRRIDRPSKDGMSRAEAIAYRRAHDELNRRGLVWLDNKYDNFAFEYHPTPSFPGELRMVITDPGGIVPIKGRNARKAAEIQSFVNGGGPTELRRSVDVSAEVSIFAVRDTKRNIISSRYADDFDVQALGFPEGAGLRSVDFNPLSVEQYPRGKFMGAVDDARAGRIYQLFTTYRRNAPSSDPLKAPAIGNPAS